MRVRAGVGLAVVLVLLAGVVAGVTYHEPSGTESPTTTTGGGNPMTSPPARQPWTSTGAPVVSAPHGADGVVLATIQPAPGQISSAAFDATSGRLLWQFPESVGARLGGLGVPTPVVVQAGSSWLAVDLEPAAQAAAVIVARDLHTGAERWRQPTGDTFGPIPCGSALCNVVGQGPSEVQRLDPSTGKTAWTLPMDDPVDIQHAFRRRLVVLTLGPNPRLMGVDLASGKADWTLATDQALGAGTTTDGGWAAVASDGLLVMELDTSKDAPGPHGLFAVDPATGKVRWKRSNLAFFLPLVPDLSRSAGVRDETLLAATLTETPTSITSTDPTRLEPMSGRSRWTLHMAVSSDQEPGVGLGDNGRTVWFGPSFNGPFKGVEMATGRPARPQAGYVVSRGPDVSVNGGTQGASFSGPLALLHVDLPSGQTTPSPVPPPARLGLTVGRQLIWLDTSGHLHGTDG